MAVDYRCCETGFTIRILIISFLVLFAGLMSGLTLGLMSMSLVDLEVLAKSGKPVDRNHAGKILPVVKRQHLLLCTLLICNATAMEALPVFLDSLVTTWVAILISVTLILLFGEIIPQAVFSRYGLAIGARVAPFVMVLVWICYPIAYPISKVLDILLGEGHEALFRRAELKTLVDFHGNEAGKGGELTRNETRIIGGALELSQKTAINAMTSIAEAFTIDINAKLDRNLMKLILEKGHSRVPVYHEKPTNIVGLVLVKNLLKIHAADEIPVKKITIRKIPRVSETMPLYDILNDFQKGHSHMAVVVKDTQKSNVGNPKHVKEVRVNIRDDPQIQEKIMKSKTSLKMMKSVDSDGNLTTRFSKSKKWSKDFKSEILQIDEEPLPNIACEGEAIGIITLEDVIEELLQKEIYDETDHGDVH